MTCAPQVNPFNPEYLVKSNYNVLEKESIIRKENDEKV